MKNSTKEKVLKPDGIKYDKGTVVVKSFIAKVSNIDEVNHTIEAVVTDESIDSYGEIIAASAWKKRMKRYKAHPVLMSSHNYYSLLNQIGEAKKVTINAEKQMVVKFEYYVGLGNAIADWAWTLATLKVAAFSVGFRVYDYEETPDWWEDKDVKAGKKARRTFTDVELFEISHVTIPSNPNALQKSLDSNDPILKNIAEGLKKQDFSDNSVAKSFDLALREVLITLKTLEKDQGEEVLFDKDVAEKKTVNIPSLVKQMVALLSEDAIAAEEKKKLYDSLCEKYTEAGKTAPTLIPYNFAEDIVLGCSDVETAIELFKTLTPVAEDVPEVVKVEKTEPEATSGDEALTELRALTVKLDVLLDAITDNKIEKEEADIEKGFISDILSATTALQKKAKDVKTSLDSSSDQS